MRTLKDCVFPSCTSVLLSLLSYYAISYHAISFATMLSLVFFHFYFCSTFFSFYFVILISYLLEHGKELSLLTFRTEDGTCLSSIESKKSQYWLALSTDENSETLESSAIDDGLSQLAMFLTVLYMVEGLETEMLKYGLMQ